MEQASQLPNSNQPIFIEIFAGRGSLSKAASQAGFSVLSIDHEATGASVPIVQLDLTSSSGTAILWDILSSENILAVHLGIPCGTASRARERPVAPALQAMGVPNPPPLRSAEFPLGMPNLSGIHQAKIESANKLYRLAVEILVYCHRRNIVVSVENPANSWLWAALVKITMELSVEARHVLNALEKVEFHACCHGSTRRKHTGWLGTANVFQALAAVCQNDHPHDPWGIRWTSAGWIFDTSTEAAYPALLSQRAVACLVKVAQARAFTLQKPPRLHDKATAALGKQTKKHRPLLPEYHHFARHPTALPLPPGAKALAPHLGGIEREEPVPMDAENSVSADVSVFSESDVFSERNANASNNSFSEEKRADVSGEFSKIGFYHTPKQFLSLACNLMHPMDATDHLEEPTRYALDFNLKYPCSVVTLERKKNLLHAKLLAVQCEAQEKELHAGLPPSLQKVLEGKRLLVWKKLLEKYQYDDMGVVDFMMDGVKLTGLHDTPSCYPELIKPARMTQRDLESSAVWRRKAIINKRSAVRDMQHVEHLEETAAEELQAGFLEGPFNSEMEVTEYFGHNQWMVIRRFVLVQGSELKLRPIDDCLESQLNQAFTSTSYLKLQDLDYTAGLAMKIAEAVSTGKQQHGSGCWLGKCLDLSKAYKQMGVNPAHRHLAVIFFHNKEGNPVFYVANSLMFGATSAVYSFNRVSRSIWYLLNRMLVIPCGVFYDDYPLFAPEESAANADMSASALLDLIGWRHARTGPKGKPFSAKFQVLGCSMDVSEIASGKVILENKPGRIDRMLEQLGKIEAAKRMSLHEAQVLHGLMRFSCGFFAGRNLHQVCTEVMSLGTASAKGNHRDVSDFCRYAASTLRACKPRELEAGGERRPVLIFTDGCWEQGHAGVGAVVVDLATNNKWIWAGTVPALLLERWKNLVGDQLICQIELYAMVALRWSLADLLCNRRSLWWVDNDAARYAVIKGSSPSSTMRHLVRSFYHQEISSPTYSWIERIPSLSNPSDGPSRGEPGVAMELLGISECLPFPHPPDLVQLLLSG